MAHHPWSDRTCPRGCRRPASVAWGASLRRPRLFDAEALASRRWSFLNASKTLRRSSGNVQKGVQLLSGLICPLLPNCSALATVSS